MTLLYIDGFEDHTASNSKWSSGLSITTPGRFGVGSCAYAGAGQYIAIPSCSEVIVGFAFKTPNWKATWWAGVGNSDGCQLNISYPYNGTGQLNLCRSASWNGTSIIGSTGQLTDTWYYVEYRATLNDTGGTAELWVDGVSKGTFTGDTRTAGTQTVFDRFYIGGDDAWGSGYIDDVYVIAVDGTAPNTRLGDSKVVTLYPNGNGTTSGGTGNDGNSTDNYLLVDEAGTVVTTDYVDFATTVKDTYAYQDSGLASGATIHGVMVSSYVAKTDAGTITAKPVVRYSGTEVDGTAVTPTGTTPIEFEEIFVTKPGGGSWTQAAIDAAEFGLKGV